MPAATIPGIRKHPGYRRCEGSVHVPVTCQHSCDDAAQRRHGLVLLNDAARKKGPVLTEQQLRVLALAAAGHTDKEIASLLGLAPSTVRAHMHEVEKRLRARTRVHALALATTLRLLPENDKPEHNERAEKGEHEG